MAILCENNQSMENDLEDGEIEDDDEEEIALDKSKASDGDVKAELERGRAELGAEKKQEQPAASRASFVQDKSLTKPSDKELTAKDKDLRGHRERRAERHHSKHDKTPRKRPPFEPEDDWAHEIERAIANIIKTEKDKESTPKGGRTDDEKSNEGNSSEEKRRGRKRRKREREREKKKKRSKCEDAEKLTATASVNSHTVSPPDDEIDEDEMLCVRGGSPKTVEQASQEPVFGPPSDDTSPFGQHYNDAYDSYSSEYDSDAYSVHRNKRGFERDRKRERPNRPRDASRRDRKTRADKIRERRNDKSRPVLQDSNSICLFYMQGKCHRGEECPYSHAVMPPLKLELCKFYLMDCCAKRDKCLYMHSEFPCKYYHTGLRCVAGERGQCKFAHGAPLSDNLKQVLLKHLETAPKEILGDFPRLSREGAQSLVNATQKKLEAHHEATESGASQSGIPSLLDIDTSVSHGTPSNDQENQPTNVTATGGLHSPATNASAPGVPAACNTAITNTKSPRSRPSRWGSEKEQVDVSQLLYKMNRAFGPNSSSVYDSLNLQDQQKIQMYHMNFSFPGMYSDKDQDMRVVSNGDVDMRSLSMPPQACAVVDSAAESISHAETDPIEVDAIVAENLAQPKEKTEEEKALTDQDMRFSHPQAPVIQGVENLEESSVAVDSSIEDDRDLEIDEPPEEMPLQIDVTDEDEKPPLPSEPADNLPTNLPKKQRELFMRLKALQKENVLQDEDDRTMEHSDKEDDWYSDDDDEDNTPLTNVLKTLVTKNVGEKERALSPVEIKPASIQVQTIGERTQKIDVSARVTKLLSFAKGETNTLPDNLTPAMSPTDPRSQPRDPRQAAGNDAPAANEDISCTAPTTTSSLDPRVKRKPETDSGVQPKLSIYEMASIDPSAESRSDVDLRSVGFGETHTQDLDMRTYTDYGDTDLRTGGGRPDVDLRQLNLPFKPMQNYVPATEIDASINCHPTKPYKVHLCDIPRPDYSGLKLSAKDPQSTADPRIRKIFRLSSSKPAIEVAEIASPEPAAVSSPKAHGSVTTTPTPPARVDPRMQRKAAAGVVPQLATGLDSVALIRPPNTLSGHLPLDQMPPLNNGTGVGASMDYNQQIQVLHSSNFYQGLTSNQKLILNQAIASQKCEQNSPQNDPILEAVLANLGLTNPMAGPNVMMNPALSLMSLLNLGANFSPMNMGPPGPMGPSPSLLGPGPGAPMMNNMVGGPMGPGNMMAGGPDGDYNMPFGSGGANRGTGLLGHSPYPGNMNIGGPPGGFGPPDVDYSFNNDGGGNPGPFFGGGGGGGGGNNDYGGGGNNDYGGGGNNEYGRGGSNKRDRGYRGERSNRRGRGGGHWNGARHGRGNFQARHNRNNRNNRSRTPP